MKQVGQATWEDKVRLTLWVDKEEVSAGQGIKVRATVENLTGGSVVYTMWNIGDPPVYTGLSHAYEEVWGPVTLRNPADPQIVMPAVVTGTLRTREVIVRDVSWDGTLATNGQSVPAPNGTYTLQAAFYPGDQSSAPEQSPLAVAHDLRVIGGADLVVPTTAMSTARSHPQVQAWWDAHTGAAIARESAGTYEIQMEGEWVPTTEEEYRRVLAEQKPETATAYDAGDWVITFASKFGPAPYELKARVDGTSGQAESVEGSEQ
jgi:hypothetical protein